MKELKEDGKHPVAIHPADVNHQVVSFVGGGQGIQKTPCAECPWRTDAKVGEFPAEAFRISANTAYDAAFEMFACHMSGIQKLRTCAGFILQNADNNIGVRLMTIRDGVNLGVVSSGGVELYEDYRAMAEANGVDPNDPVLAPCRGNFD